MTETVERKACFGDYMGERCKEWNQCVWQGKCFNDTSLRKGACDCPYKVSCHLSRQWLAAILKREDSSYQCSFVAMFEKDQKMKEGRTMKKQCFLMQDDKEREGEDTRYGVAIYLLPEGTDISVFSKNDDAYQEFAVEHDPQERVYAASEDSAFRAARQVCEINQWSML